MPWAPAASREMTPSTSAPAPQQEKHSQLKRGWGQDLRLPWPSSSTLGLRRCRSQRPNERSPHPEPPHNHAPTLCFPKPSIAYLSHPLFWWQWRLSVCGGYPGPDPLSSPPPVHPAGQLTFLYRGAQRPPPRALSFLEETVSDGICGSRRKQSGGSRRRLPTCLKGPQAKAQGGTGGALAPRRKAGVPIRPAPPPGAWPGRAPRGAPP